jgi:hypothetical protein
VPRQARRPTTFELVSGVGPVWQPQLGLPGAAALWTVQILGWGHLAARGSKRADPLLAALAGASLAGVVVHYILWPWKPGRGRLPVLTEAEGLSPWQMPSYNVLLRLWALASAGSVLLELPRGSRRWTLVGGASLPLFLVSARHHFAWVKEQAASNPTWWNRGISLIEPTEPSADEPRIGNWRRVLPGRLMH